ncbi:aldehyde dehydrogenase family protein [Candidatus Poribacteria bacterium]|nr:aldehyde dehydrogenase family protein [Candidatus Poribacteria bacterium]
MNKELIEKIQEVFDFQKSHYSPAKTPSYQLRIDRLTRIEQMCRKHVKEITQALQQDFGTRHPDLIFLADIFPQISHAKYVKKHLKSWMKKEKTSSGLLAFTGQSSYFVNEPLGVVGIMSPFNAPVSLALDPAVDAIAAGNSVMIKISESTPETANLMKILVNHYFNSEEVVVVTGDSEVSKFFASLPWDKFVFTGGSEVGKHILKAAAQNLTPVLLELGGKSPCIILEDADIPEVAHKIMKVRLMNAGQVCISGDYVMLPKQHLDDFIQSILESAKETYPNIIDNEDFTSVIDNRAYDRITGYIDEAINEGCRVIESNPMNENVPDRKSRKIPLTLVINPSQHLQVCENEIFGPVLSVFTYESLRDAIQYINSKPKPLALYIFGKNKTEINQVINNTSSGGVTVNDLLMHADSKEMGFGGVGYSGMGRYKGGLIGYKAFSNPKSVVEQGFLRRFTERFIPPMKNDTARKMLRNQVGVKY